MIPSATSALALDLGGTKIAAAVVTPSGDLLGEQVAPTNPEEGPAEVLRRLFRLGRSSLKATGLLRPARVGITSGGPLDAASGVLHEPLHLPGWRCVAIGQLATEEFGVQSFLANDGTAAAWGEYLFGAGRSAAAMLYLTLSTGVGGGAVLHGRPHLGATGNGGEFGHITVCQNGRPCSCSRRGCLEAYCSGTSIGARAREAMPDHPEMTAQNVVTAVKSGDPRAISLWDETVQLLADGLTSLINIFEPDRVVLGGGVANAGSILIDPVQAIVAKQSVGTAADCQVVLSARPDQCGLLGAGAIALHPVTTSRPDSDDPI